MPGACNWASTTNEKRVLLHTIASLSCVPAKAQKSLRTNSGTAHSRGISGSSTGFIVLTSEAAEAGTPLLLQCLLHREAMQ